MSITDYLIDSALVLLVLLQIKERTLTTQTIVRPLIIVGIYNTGESRIEEYTPTRVDNRGGFADLYGRLLVEELKPLIH